jgi:hypothetical protein
MPVFSIDTANTLLTSVHDLFHDLGGLWGDSTHVQDLKLQEFLHAGSKVQGLAATKAIKTGESVYLEPPHLTVNVPAEDSKLPGFGHLKDEYEKLGFWLAQAKHDLVDHPPADLKLPRSDEIIVQYIRSLPSLTDLKKQGVPLAASYSDLHKLDGLPHLGALSKSVDKQREALLDNWAEYTKARGNLPKIGYADALWGLTIARSQGVTFPHSDSVNLLPVSDMLNYSDEGNVVIEPVELAEKLPMKTTAMVHLKATKDIASGTEMLLSYGNGQQTQGLDLLAKHGFFESGKLKDTWSTEDCAKINAALPHETLEKSKMLAAVDKLIQQSCPSVEKAVPAKAGAATDIVKSAAGGASDAVKPPTEQVVNPLFALVSPPGCRSTPSRDSRYSRFL